MSLATPRSLSQRILIFCIFVMLGTYIMLCYVYKKLIYLYEFMYIYMAFKKCVPSTKCNIGTSSWALVTGLFSQAAFFQLGKDYYDYHTVITVSS